MIKGTEKVRVAVISDVHACLRAAAVSYVLADDPQGCPFDALHAYMDSHPLEADYLLVGGDITDKADPTAFEHAWDKLKKLAAALGAELIGTVGNHDLDSRGKDDPEFDPRHIFQRHAERFPSADGQASADQYWSRHFTIIDRPDILVLVVNSCAFHGYNNQAVGDEEYRVGRITRTTIEQIQVSLRGISDGADRPRYLLVHHHPIQHAEPSGKSVHFVNAPLLLGALEEDPTGWLVIHGHKHIPSIAAAQSAGSPITVFSAASFSRHKEVVYNEAYANQFYIIDSYFPEAALSAGLNPVAGSYRAWSFQPSPQGPQPASWRIAQAVDGLPGSGGFGCPNSPAQLANEIATAANQHGGLLENASLSRYTWLWNHLLPGQRETLVQQLSARDFETNLASDQDPRQAALTIVRRKG